jgi:hypothetical protein
MKKFHATYREAKKELDRVQRTNAGYKYRDYVIYDLKKTFPKRIKTRYFIGNYFQWLNI